MARHTSGSGSGAFVTALTVAALAVVAFFAFQASAADDSPTAPDRAGASPSDEASDPAEGAEPSVDPLAVPESSGEGKRVVYALERQRVWLVSADGTAVDTYEVHPSSVSPPPGEYAVTSRWAQGTGSDGAPIEHSVIFHTTADGIVFGFSATLDGSTPDPEAELRTGAVRQSRANGDTMWLFADEGLPVVVVP